MIQILKNYLKNIYGWKTDRKIVVFSVDDYGNVRVDSRKARQEMDKAGLKIYSRFDAYDTLETREDLEILYETLMSVRDKNGRHAVFTPFAVPCNIDFEKIVDEGYNQYVCEELPVTYEKLSALQPGAYEKTWEMWKEGIDKGLMVPQFHGREHLNIKVFNEKLSKKDSEVLIALKNRSYTSIGKSKLRPLGVYAAFDFWDLSDISFLNEVLADGLIKFKDVFGFNALHFMPPSSIMSTSHFRLLKENGVKFIDSGLIQKNPKGFGKHSITVNYTGKNFSVGQYFIVRNVVFEPSGTPNINSVDNALRQIEAAFHLNRPAIVSSHRVNFCGHIDPKNRKKGIFDLKELLKKIATKWPDVEFLALNELGNLMIKTLIK